MSFGELIKLRRATQDITLQLLADRIGIDTGSISRIENEQTDATLMTAIRLCNGLNISLAEVSEALSSTEGGLSGGATMDAIPSIVMDIDDVSTFIELFYEDPQKGAQFLAYWLNEISSQFLLPEPMAWEKIATASSEEFSHQLAEQEITFLNAEDIKLFLAKPLLYRYEIQYPQEMTIEDILSIYQWGSAMILKDVEIYAGLIRREVAGRKDIGRQLDGVLSRIETGAVERIKLIDVVALDAALQQKGLILGMYWKAYTFNDAVLSRLGEGPLQKILTVQRQQNQALRLANLFMMTCRWLFSNWGPNTYWLVHMRRELGILAEDAYTDDECDG